MVNNFNTTNYIKTTSVKTANNIQ